MPSSGTPNAADYRFGVESTNDGTVTFWQHQNNLNAGVTMSELQGALSGVAAASAAVALALLSF